MKGLKKLLTGILAATMIMGSSMTVMATGNGTGTGADGLPTQTQTQTFTITINDSRPNRKFTAYQIVAADLDTVDGNSVLTNLKWGASSGKTGELSDSEIETIRALDGQSHTAFEAYIKNLFGVTNDQLVIPQGDGYTSTVGTEQNTYSISVPSGWYYILETTDTNEKDDFSSAFMMQVSGNTIANVKGSKTEVVKKVQDINDSDSSVLTSLQDSADYDIGDDVPYTLTATIGDNLTGFNADTVPYELIFYDTMSSGLTFKQLDGVYVDNVKKDNSIVECDTISNSDGTTTTTFTIDNILKEAVGAAAGSTIKLEYTATLNNDAVIGKAGNPNTVYLEYSNKPGTDEHGKTPDDYNIVFTYKLIVNKVDSNKRPLTGAGFTLYKKMSTAVEGVTQTGAQIKEAYGENTRIKASNLDNSTNYKVIGSVAGDSAAQFVFKGIDDGDYVLVETTIPQGYNAWESAVIHVSASHSTTVNSLSDTILTALNGGNNVLFTESAADIDAGSLSTDIENKSGVTLPSTGGIGTTIFYIIGGVLIIAGVAYFIVRRKADAE